MQIHCYLAGKAQLRGWFFEIVTRKLLQDAGFSPIQNDGKLFSNGKVKGRGTWHQIDAYGIYSHSIPFVHPIRLISECKYYKDSVGLPLVRNFFGAFRDISENYFVDRNGKKEDVLLKRYTDAAAMFSVTRFAKPAQEFAYAHGIFLVSYDKHHLLRPVVKPIFEIVEILRDKGINEENDKGDLKEAIEDAVIRNSSGKLAACVRKGKDFRQQLTSLQNSLAEIRTSLIGNVGGVYPLHFLSKSSLNELLPPIFPETQANVTNVEGDNEEIELRLSLRKNFELVCTFPTQVVRQYISLYEKTESKFFDYVDILLPNFPITFRAKFEPQEAEELRNKILSKADDTEEFQE